MTASDVDLTMDLLWSFNRWLEEDWGFAHAGRLFVTPVISLADVDEAVRMLEWALERGARALMVRPSPVPTRMGWRSPADPMFDSLRRWTHGRLPDEELPVEWTLASMDAAGVAVGLLCAWWGLTCVGTGDARWCSGPTIRRGPRRTA